MIAVHFDGIYENELLSGCILRSQKEHAVYTSTFVTQTHVWTIMDGYGAIVTGPVAASVDKLTKRVVYGREVHKNSQKHPYIELAKNPLYMKAPTWPDYTFAVRI